MVGLIACCWVEMMFPVKDGLRAGSLVLKAATKIAAWLAMH